MIHVDALHVVHAGCVLHGGKILKKGMVWGEDMLIASRHLRSRFTAKAITYLEAFYLTRDQLFQACSPPPPPPPPPAALLLWPPHGAPSSYGRWPRRLRRRCSVSGGARASWRCSVTSS